MAYLKLTAKIRFHGVSPQFHSLGLGINTMMSLVKKITIFETCLFMTTEGDLRCRIKI